MHDPAAGVATPETSSAIGGLNVIIKPYSLQTTVHVVRRERCRDGIGSLTSLSFLYSTLLTKLIPSNIGLDYNETGGGEGRNSPRFRADLASISSLPPVPYRGPGGEVGTAFYKYTFHPHRTRVGAAEPSS